MTTTTPPVIYPPGSTPPHAEASLGSKEFNPKIPIESEECNSMPPNGKSCWFPVGYRGEMEFRSWFVVLVVVVVVVFYVPTVLQYSTTVQKLFENSFHD